MSTSQLSSVTEEITVDTSSPKISSQMMVDFCTLNKNDPFTGMK
jgi:hypothetical protein